MLVAIFHCLFNFLHCTCIDVLFHISVIRTFIIAINIYKLLFLINVFSALLNYIIFFYFGRDTFIVLYQSRVIGVVVI